MQNDADAIYRLEAGFFGGASQQISNIAVNNFDQVICGRDRNVLSP
jgi:hypothetical protein